MRILDFAGIPKCIAPQSRHVDMLKSENYTDPEILKYRQVKQDSFPKADIIISALPVIEFGTKFSVILP